MMFCESTEFFLIMNICRAIQYFKREVLSHLEYYKDDEENRSWLLEENFFFIKYCRFQDQRGVLLQK